VAACSPARDVSSNYIAWGHSTIVDPNGAVIAKAGADEEIVYADLDFNSLTSIRDSIPVTKQRRFDVYRNVVEK
jgi:omega-amidase